MKQFVVRAYHASKLLAKTHAPTIMVTTGVVSMGVGAVVGAKKTLRIEEVLAPHAQSLDAINEGVALGLEGYGPTAARSDTIKVYTRITLDLGKLYAVPVILFAGGTGLVFGGHHIMLKRNATLAIAFTGLKKSFDFYRQNVVEEFGSEADQAMLNGYVTKEVYDDATGKTEVIRTRDWDGEQHDPYNRVFEEGASTQWRDDLGVNKMFVANQQRMANLLLSDRGHLYLNDVYESLGFPKTDVGQVCGWKVRKLPDGSRDIPFVDFGIDKPHPDDWKYNREAAIYLDINCQGLIVGGDIQKALEKA